MDAFIKYLAKHEVLWVIMAWRYFFGAIYTGCIFLYLRPVWLGLKSLPFHFFRSLLQLIAVGTFFWALTQISLVEATALGFTSVLMIAPIARIVLHEPITKISLLAVFVGFAGAIIIISTGTADVNPDGNSLLGYLCVLISSLFYAITLVLLRLRSRVENAITLVTTTNVIVAIIFLPVLIIPATVPDLKQLSLYALAGVLGVGIWLLITLAYAKSPASKLAPFEYTSLIWASLIGWQIFNEVPSAQFWVGALVIMLACILTIFEEQLKSMLKTNKIHEQ